MTLPGTPSTEADLNDLVVGIAVETNGSRLFYGGVSPPNSNVVPLWSIDLTAGQFTGNINNAVLPAGANWDNYVGIPTFHTLVTTEFPDPTLPGLDLFYFISDLEFTSGPNPKLLVGIRVGCDRNWHSSYNHTGEANEISPDGNGIYNQSIIEFDVSPLATFSQEDGYGGVSDFRNPDGNVDYVVSYSDILNFVGPHGLNKRA